MRFRTELKPDKFPFVLDPNKPIAALGSCFADNIVNRMKGSGWNASNPFGTLFNPISIASALKLALNNDPSCFENTLFNDGSSWRSFSFGSIMADKDRENVIARFNDAVSKLKGTLSKAETILITFGTSRVYSLKDHTPEYIVGNCHKQPDRMFIRRRLTVDEIVECWKETITLLRSHYPELKVIFTVSPVRHLRDGAHGNTLSKAILHIAVEELCEECQDVFYFPAYEILNDDLRDYRFYDTDLVHPSEAGIEYIWEKFTESLLDTKGREVLLQGEKRIKAEKHIPNFAANKLNLMSNNNINQ